VFVQDVTETIVVALGSNDVENKINYCQLLSQLCQKEPGGHATALTICEQLKVNY